MMGAFLHEYGLLVALAAAGWVLHDARKRGSSWLKACCWSLATFLVLIIFLPLWLFMRPPLPPTSDRP